MTQTIWHMPSQAGVVVKTTPETLDEVKAYYKARINADAENCRAQFLTGGFGMVMTYLEKHNQAQAVLEMGEAAANALTPEQIRQQFPTLAASVGREAATIYACAVVVASRYETWASVSFPIECNRLDGHTGVSNASDAAAVQAAYEALTWPSP